jgi:hypothetical protein
LISITAESNACTLGEAKMSSAGVGLGWKVTNEVGLGLAVG